MLSVIFCSRVKGNPDSNLPRMLDSAVAHTTPEEQRQIEFLIKYDDDDTERPPDSFFTQYPFRIRSFSFSRGDGRHSLHHAQEYLFAQRDPRSRWLLMTADDFRLAFAPEGGAVVADPASEQHPVAAARVALADSVLE